MKSKSNKYIIVYTDYENNILGTVITASNAKSAIELFDNFYAFSTEVISVRKIK